ncbi:hypothetical protein N8310_02220 [Pseudomonadota bacterium]|nr:hypothetical protein [Pseudomonadota bacterium]
MNILIFGGTRFIGKEVVNLLKKMYINITVFSRNLDVENKVTHIAGDRNKLEDIKRIKGTFDVIVDFISYDAKHTETIINLFPSARYILISTAWKAIKFSKKSEIKFNYIKGKRLAEGVVLRSNVANNKNTIIRLPIVLGLNDHTKRTNFFRTINDKKSKIIYLTNPDLDIYFCWKSQISKFLIEQILKKVINPSPVMYPPNYFNIKLSDYIKIHQSIWGVNYIFNNIDISKMCDDKSFRNYLNFIGEDFYFKTEIYGKSIMKIESVDKLKSFLCDLYEFEPL